MARRSKHSEQKENYLGLLGWAWAGRYGLERYLYILHRISGIGLILYLFLHIYESGLRLQGQEVWEGLIAIFNRPLFKASEYLLFAAFIFHALNGFRLILAELGFFLGRPRRPVYPYRNSLVRQRPLMWALMILAAIFIIIGGFNFFAL